MKTTTVYLAGSAVVSLTGVESMMLLPSIAAGTCAACVAVGAKAIAKRRAKAANAEVEKDWAMASSYHKRGG
jgi:hypothetical protein